MTTLIRSDASEQKNQLQGMINAAQKDRKKHGTVCLISAINGFEWELYRSNKAPEYALGYRCSSLKRNRHVFWKYRGSTAQSLGIVCVPFMFNNIVHGAVVLRGTVHDVIDLNSTTGESVCEVMSQVMKVQMMVAAFDQCSDEIDGIHFGKCSVKKEELFRIMDMRLELRDAREKRLQEQATIRQRELDEHLRQQRLAEKAKEHLPVMTASFKAKKGGQVYDKVPVFRDIAHLNLCQNVDSTKLAGTTITAVQDNACGFVGYKLSGGRRQIGTLYQLNEEKEVA